MSRQRQTLAQAPSEHRHSGYNELEEPETPATASWTDDRAPLRTTSPETIEPGPTSPRWKGKGRAIENGVGVGMSDGATAEVDSGRRAASQDDVKQELVSSTYPPATEEAVEEQKVNEVRWSSKPPFDVDGSLITRFSPSLSVSILIIYPLVYPSERLRHSLT